MRAGRVYNNQIRAIRERLLTYSWAFRRTPSFLEVLAIFKDEASILQEWVQHYLDQGVDRINLINNNSSDAYHELLEPFIDAGKVILSHDERRYAQAAAYEEALPILRRQTRWLIICDLDEFIYAREGYSTIRDYLHSVGSEVSCIQIPWKIFGSSGFFHQPPTGVRLNFVHRKHYQDLSNEDFGVLNGQISCKYIARLDRVRHLYVHRADLFWGTNQLPDGTAVDSQVRQPISEEALQDYPVHCNHYPLQSEEFFRRVKMTRGDTAYPGRETMRTMSYFRQYDINEYRDDELSRLVKTRDSQVI